MATLQDLQTQIKASESRGDLRGIVKLRAQMAHDFPGTTEAAEALFRLGLYFLFVEANVESAMQTLEESAKIKDGNWSKAARVSLASLYLREGKPQKALLELRKTLGDKDPPSIHTVSALSIVEMIHEQAEETQLARGAKEDKAKQLEALAKLARDAHDDGTLAFWLISLAAEKRALGENATSRKLYEEVQAMGATRAGDANFKEAHAALK